VKKPKVTVLGSFVIDLMSRAPLCQHSLVSKKRCTSKDTPNLVNSVSGRRQEKQSLLKDKKIQSLGGVSFLLPSLRKQNINAFNMTGRGIDCMSIYSMV